MRPTKLKITKDHSEIIKIIETFNAGRDPERLAMKYAKMAQSPFSFLRGACHLFYETLPDLDVFRDAPLAWCCGDLHFENFGSYKADNRLVYFDISDYDEAALAPVTWDIVRLLTSIQCGADSLNATEAEALAVSQWCLNAYRDALGNGKALLVEPETSSGLVYQLLSTLHTRERSVFLDKRTIHNGNRRSLRIDGVKALAASDEKKLSVHELIAEFAAMQKDQAFFEVLDIGRCEFRPKLDSDSDGTWTLIPTEAGQPKVIT